MLTPRHMMLMAALGLLAATLAIVVHDIRCALQLSRILARAPHARVAHAVVKESAEAKAQSPQAEQGRCTRRARLQMNRTATTTASHEDDAQGNCNSGA